MSRHSKNNTAQSFFTKHEFERLDYGTRRERLGRDSIRGYDVCHICIGTARDPVICGRGHISCRECAERSIEKQLEARVRARARAARANKNAKEAQEAAERAERAVERAKEDKDAGADIRGKEAMEEAITEAEVAKLRAAKMREMALCAKVTGLGINDMAKKKDRAYCMCGKDPHSVSIGELYTVKFKEGAVSGKKECGICSREFGNVFGIKVLIKCGHVVCSRCEKTFLLKESLCGECGAPCALKDLLEIYVESGRMIAEKIGVTFG